MDAADKLPFIHADYEGYPVAVGKLRERYLEYPRSVSIETLVKCNARCYFCPYPNSSRQGQVLPNELFHKIVGELCDIPPSHSFALTLTRINEPLLDSRLKEFSDLIAEKLPSANQQFWTNGTMLKEGKFEWMSQYSRATLTVSLNSTNEEEHVQMMGFGLNGVFRGLDYLHGLAESGQFALPVKLCAPFRNNKQAKEYEEFCRNRWPLFIPAIRPFFRWMGGTDIGEKDRNTTLLPMFPINRVAAFPCAQWFDLHILANGYTTKCCIDEKGQPGNAAFDVRYHHVLDIYRKSIGLREGLPARSNISGCEGCFHLG